MSDEGYVSEVIISKRKTKEKLQVLGGLFKERYQISHHDWFHVMRFEFRGPIGDEKMQKLRELQEGERPVVDSYYVGAANKVRREYNA